MYVSSALANIYMNVHKQSALDISVSSECPTTMSFYRKNKRHAIGALLSKIEAKSENEHSAKIWTIKHDKGAFIG